MVLFFLQDRLEKHFGVIIPNLSCKMDAFVVTSDSHLFGSMVILMHIWYLSADDYLGQLADDRLPFQKNYAGDQFLSVLHLGDGSRLDHLFQLLVIPVFTHLSMDNILIDSS
jgi:hypothetical protein